MQQQLINIVSFNLVLSICSSAIFLPPFISLKSAGSVYVEARFETPPNETVPAVYGFGDSIIDPGNNNDIKSLVKCDFPPYGKDFAGGMMPNGRFSNGKIPTDLLVDELGIKEYLPAYLDPNLKPEELLTGVCFASGASGYDPMTSKLASVISLSQQLKYFEEAIVKMKGMVGEGRTNFILANSLFLIVGGSDDIANTYFDTPFRRKEYDVDSYTNLLLNYATSFVKELYGLGARRIGVFGAPPVGCVPSQRTIGGGKSRACAENYNEMARLFNSKLSSQLDSMTNSLPKSKLVYIDIYNPLLDLIQNGTKYGFEVTDRGCCGTGLVEVTVLCNKFDAVCSDDTKYLFWDSYHPTQMGYEYLVEGIGKKYISRFF